jgi:hypothetical protein
VLLPKQKSEPVGEGAEGETEAAAPPVLVH